MTKYVALLRGINVGGRTIAMIDLKTCFESLGFSGVTTVLQTGNVLFESSYSSDLKQVIEVGLRERFKYPAKVQVLPLERLKSIVADCPFTEFAQDVHRYVVFLENGLERSLIAEVSELDESVESIVVGNGVVYWQVLKGMTLKSSFAKYLAKAAYRELNTNRNMNTLQKLLK